VSELIFTEKAIKEYVDKFKKMDLEKCKFILDYLQFPKIEDVKISDKRIERVTDLPKLGIENMDMITSSTTSSGNYKTYYHYEDKIFYDKYFSSDKFLFRGSIEPCEKKENEKAKQTKFLFDPTGMTDQWKKPKD
jgi:hypothetical protein